MHSSYYISKRLVLFHILAIYLLIRSVSSMNLTNAYLHHKCLVRYGNYKQGSQYEINLSSLTRTLSTLKFLSGFTSITRKNGTSPVTIVFQCRGDSYGAKCRSCFATAVAGIHKRCQRNKKAIIWYDQCFLEISPVIRSETKIDYENTFPMYNPDNVNEDKKLFNKMTRDLLYKLIGEANKGDKSGLEMLYYAAGEKVFGTEKLYAMVQCAKDTIICGDCLKWSIRELSKCCDGKRGARILGTTCNLRYELYPFLTT